MARKDIIQELNELGSSLAGTPSQNLYSVPQGYFEAFASSVLSRINAENGASFLSELSKSNPYKVPVGYFDALAENVMNAVRNHPDHLNSQEELEILSPLLNSLKKEPVFSVPQNYFENFNPALGKSYSLIPDSDERDIDLAVQAAESAFPSWSVTPVQQRSKILLKIASLISRDLDKLASAETTDTGKPIALSRIIDIPRAVSNFEFFANAIINFQSESHATEDKALNYTLRQPAGIVGAISPWNLPLYLFTWKIAPALAAGNCVVAKPSELAPMTAYQFSQL